MPIKSELRLEQAMAPNKEILTFNKSLGKDARAICDCLAEIIDAKLPKAESKIWHGAPVWFLDGNPLVGYSQKRAGVELLFWSGQDFGEEKLLAVGKFKAAGIIYIDINDVKQTVVKRWLVKSKKIQWDYANVVKNRKLVKLTSF